jgi:hypothetical protein
LLAVATTAMLVVVAGGGIADEVAKSRPVAQAAEINVA